MVSELSGKKVIKVQSDYFHGNHMMAAGSIIDHAQRSTIIWGSGLISSSIEFKSEMINVRAVRGKLTRQRLIERGVACPEIYGDPALLIPKLYPKLDRHKKIFKLGVIPHYVDKEHEWIGRIKKDENVLLIDIQNANIFAFIDEVLSCDVIVSSSLHGLIVADAYQIPNVWIRLSDDVIGGDFKFLDYYSVSDRNPECFGVESIKSVYELLKFADRTNFRVNFEDLMMVFPYPTAS
jgi:pyruvyltransferase